MIELTIALLILSTLSAVYYGYRLRKRKKKFRYDFYLAGPMRGYPEMNTPLFNRAAKRLRDQGYTVFNPAEVNDEHLSFEECMTVDLDAVVNQCNAIAILPGWRDSIGSNGEVFTAFLCGKDVFEVDLESDPDLVVLTKVLTENYKLPYKKQTRRSRKTSRTKTKAKTKK